MEKSSNLISKSFALKNMVCNCCVRVIRDELTKKGIPVKHIRLGEVTVQYDPGATTLQELLELFENLGFEVVNDKEKILVQEIKTAVIELIHYANNNSSLIRNSDYIVDKLGYSYQYLSTLFSKHEELTLEKYIIKHKIEKVKEFLEYNEMSISEIAFQLGYSSTQYLSTQFKNITGYSIGEYKSIPGLRRKGIDDF